MKGSHRLPDRVKRGTRAEGLLEEKWRRREASCFVSEQKHQRTLSTTLIASIFTSRPHCVPVHLSLTDVLEALHVLAPLTRPVISSLDHLSPSLLRVYTTGQRGRPAAGRVLLLQVEEMSPEAAGPHFPESLEGCCQTIKLFPVRWEPLCIPQPLHLLS